MTTIYEKEYESLTDEERRQWHIAYQVLADGGRLYGTHKNDVTHISWTIQQAIARLLTYYDGLSEDKQEYAGGIMFIELGLSPDGLFIAVLPEEFEEAENESDEII